ncbi:MAG: hypothetical protein Q9177_003690 [Variospora cf. flavescens]
MAVLLSPLTVPPPKKDNAYTLGITGLPPQCSTRLGWQIVKDLVRVVLENHGIIERNSRTKPGMVHMSTSLVEVSETGKDASRTEHKDDETVNRDEKLSGPAFKKTTKQVITAHINMKSSTAAWQACNTIAGNRLWGYPLTAAVFPSTAEDESVRDRCHEDSSGSNFPPCKAREASQWQEPHELGDRFRITVPGGGRTWYRSPDGKATKVGTDTTKSKKRQVEEAPSMQIAQMERGRSDMSNCPTLVDGTPPAAQTQSHEDSPGGIDGQYPSLTWVRDWHGHRIPAYQSMWGQMYGLPPSLQGSMQLPEYESVAKETTHPTLDDIIAHDSNKF